MGVSCAHFDVKQDFFYIFFRITTEISTPPDKIFQKNMIIKVACNGQLF